MKALLIITALLMGAVSPLLVHAAEPSPKSGRVAAKIYGDANHGREVVTQWCVNCHKAGPRLDDQVPSLESLATNPTHTEGVIRAFLMQPHRPMPPLELSTQQIEDIIAYLHTLRPEPGQSP